MELKGFQIGAKRLQIGAGISNQDKEISNQGRYYKSGQERLQTGAGITNWCRTDGTRSLPTVSMNNQNWFEICLMIITSIILGNTVTNKI